MCHERWIIHTDMDAFFAAVEQRDAPSLRGKPVVVGGSPEGRGVVAAASYEARRYGIHSAMPSAEARRRCPDTVFISPNHNKYRSLSTQIMALLEEYTPQVEQLSVDEAFLDVTGSLRLHGSACHIGEQIRRRIADTFHLTASVGIGPNKFIAKLASEQAKPDGLLEVPPEDVLEFLAHLPVEALWGVGESTTRKLHRLGFNTIGQIQNCPVRELAAQLGTHGRTIAKLARGQDDSPVRTDRQRKSVSHEQTFPEDTADAQFLRTRLLELSGQVGHRLRTHQLKGKTVTLKLRFSDFRTLTRSTTLPQPTNSDQQIYKSACALLETVKLAQHKVRLLGVAVNNLDRGGQLPLLAQPDSSGAAVDSAIDEIRQLFGRDSVRRARLVDEDSTDSQPED